MASIPDIEPSCHEATSKTTEEPNSMADVNTVISDENQSPEEAKGSDRRCHYRVDDALVFEYKPVQANALRKGPAEEFFPEKQDHALLNELKALDNEGQTLLREIATENRPLAIYLSIMNRKTELIAHHLCMGDAEGLEPVPLNLSEGGISFSHHSPLFVGEYLALSLRIPNEAWEIYTYGRIVRCLSALPAGFQIAVAFCDINPNQEKLLTRRVFKVQMQSHRNRP